MSSAKAGGSGKTRATSAHGPSAAKKAYKAPSGPVKPSAATATKPTRPFAAVTSSATPFTHKRKAEEGSEKKVEEPEKRQVVSALLNTPEEIDFPRGGGTNLTQVEVREAQLEGEKEANAEEKVSSV
jgi:rRNA biogenesis protein RRP5